MRLEVVDGNVDESVPEGREGGILLCRELGEEHPGRRNHQCKGPKAACVEVEGSFRRQWMEIIRA